MVTLMRPVHKHEVKKVPHFLPAFKTFSTSLPGCVELQTGFPIHFCFLKYPDTTPISH